MSHLQNTDGHGHLLVGEHLSPVSYRLSVTQSGQGYSARLAVEASRDWLLKQGFEGLAMLVLANGNRIQIRHDGPVDAGQSLTFEMHSDLLPFADRKALISCFPDVDPDLLHGDHDLKRKTDTVDPAPSL